MYRNKKRNMLLAPIFLVCVLAGCTVGSSGDKEFFQTQAWESSDIGTVETGEMKKELVESAEESEAVTELKETTESEAEAGTETEPETNADDYGAVKVSELDYDSFQSRMTEEEWEGFQQYFPVLKENMPFHYAHFGNSTPLNKDGEPVREDEYKLFIRYASEEIMDINQYVADWDSFGECLIVGVRVFDLDEDGVQELILETKPGNYFLILHREDEEFYGWQIMYRGFEGLQTNRVYISSGGAGANLWKTIRFDSGSWLEEVLAEEDWGKYYLHGEVAEEAAYQKQVDDFWTGDVTAYEPKRRTD